MCWVQSDSSGSCLASVVLFYVLSCRRSPLHPSLLCFCGGSHRKQSAHPLLHFTQTHRGDALQTAPNKTLSTVVFVQSFHEIKQLRCERLWMPTWLCGSSSSRRTPEKRKPPSCWWTVVPLGKPSSSHRSSVNMISCDAEHNRSDGCIDFLVDLQFVFVLLDFHQNSIAFVRVCVSPPAVDDDSLPVNT